MADFLNHLPTVPKNELPANSECIICLLPYDTANDSDTIEYPVRLPVRNAPSSQNRTIAMLYHKQASTTPAPPPLTLKQSPLYPSPRRR